MQLRISQIGAQSLPKGTEGPDDVLVEGPSRLFIFFAPAHFSCLCSRLKAGFTHIWECTVVHKAGYTSESSGVLVKKTSSLTLPLEMLTHYT